MSKLNTKFSILLSLLMLLPLASAYTLTPVLTYNSVANTLTLSYIITPSTSSNTIAIVLNNSIQDITVNSITISNIYITNTPISNTLSTGALTPSINQPNITFEVPPFPKINKNITLGYDGNYINSAYNISVYAPKYPSAVSNTLTFISSTALQTQTVSNNNFTVNVVVKPIPASYKTITLTPNYTTQTQKLSANNFTVNITLNPIPKLNQIIHLNYSGNYINSNLNLSVFAPLYPTLNKKVYLGYDGNYINSLLNLSVYAPLYPTINKKIYANASWTGTVLAYNNPQLNLSVYINQIQKLNLNKTLTFGETYTNSTYGITFSAQQVTVNDINPNLLEQYYSSQVNNATCGSYITANNLKICTTYKNGTTINVLTLCLASQFTNASGLTSCMQRLFMVANQSAQMWKYIAQNWENMYNKTYQQLQLANQTIKNQVIYANQLELFGAVILGIMAIAFIAAMYIDRRKKQAVVLR